MRKVQRDFELCRRYYFPYATFVSGIQIGERRTRYRAVGRFDYAAASVWNAKRIIKKKNAIDIVIVLPAPLLGK